MLQLHLIFLPIATHNLQGRFSLFLSCKLPPKTSAVKILLERVVMLKFIRGVFQMGSLLQLKGTPNGIIGDFLSELGIMAHVNHPNTAKLIGYGIEGSKDKLKWGIRFKIALGTAEGLRYLHESCKRRIIHRDIKAANVLLTKDFEPQICDFGLAKMATRALDSPHCIRVRRHIRAKSLLKKNDNRELIDPALGEDYNARKMNLVLLAASSCIHQSSIRRPQMNQVVQLLNGNTNSVKSVRKHRIPFFRKAFHEEIFNAEDLSSAKSYKISNETNRLL